MRKAATCPRYFGLDPCTQKVFCKGMCQTHYLRWKKGQRGDELDKIHHRRAGLRKIPSHTWLEALARAQADTMIEQERTLNAAALIVSFASLE